MANLNHYHFRTVWRLRFRPDEVFPVLADLETYPQWWPGMRRVRRLDATTFDAGTMACS